MSILSIVIKIVFVLCMVFSLLSSVSFIRFYMGKIAIMDLTKGLNENVHVAFISTLLFFVTCLIGLFIINPIVLLIYTYILFSIFSTHTAYQNKKLSKYDKELIKNVKKGLENVGTKA